MTAPSTNKGRSIQRTETFTVQPTPEELATMVASMGQDEQARFFNALGVADESWGSGGWPVQLQYVTDCETLEAHGRRIMRLIGEYADA